MNKKIKKNQGMSYLELIVVLSIFSVMSTVVIFNYGDFQARVDIKNLASDIALRIVQAQKSALSGSLSSKVPTVSPWKPAYGVYFNLIDNKSFTYFTDLNNDNQYDGSACGGSGECVDKITITKNNIISRMDVFYQGGTSASLNDLTIIFTRPNSSASISSTTTFTLPVSYVQITVTTPKGSVSLIKLYPSGRVQIN